MRLRLVSVREATERTLGTAEVDEATGAVTGSTPGAVQLVEGALRRAGGRLEALPGWTNGYVALRASR